MYNKLAKIVSNAINEVFDFNEVNSNNEIDLHALNPFVVMHSILDIMKKYWDFNFDKNAWTIWLVDDYFLLIPKKSYKENIIYTNNLHANTGINGEEITHIDAILPFISLLRTTNTCIESIIDDKKHATQVYIKARKQIVSKYFPNTKAIINLYNFNAEILFYSHDFMIFNSTEIGPEYPPFIYVKPDDSMHVNEQYINKEKLFTNLWLYNYSKSIELYELAVNSIYLKYNYCILMLNSLLNLGYSKFLRQYDTSYTLYSTPKLPDLQIIECRNLIGLSKFTGDKNIKCKKLQIIDGSNSGKEIFGLVLNGDLYKEYKNYLKSCGLKLFN